MLQKAADDIDEQFKSIIDSILLPDGSVDDLYELAVGDDMLPGGQ